MEARISDALADARSKKMNVHKAYEQAHALSSAGLLFTIQWKDLEEHLDSIETGLTERLERLEERERTVEDRGKKIDLKEKELILMQRRAEDCAREMLVKEDKLYAVERKVKECEKEVELKKEKLKFVVDLLLRTSQDVDSQTARLLSLQKSLDQCNGELDAKRGELRLVQGSLEDCSRQLKSKGESLSSLKKDLDEFCTAVEGKRLELLSVQESLESCYNEIASKERELGHILSLIQERDEELNQKEAHLDSLKVLIEENSEELAVKEKNYCALQKWIKERTAELDVKNSELDQKRKMYEKLSEKIKSTECILEHSRREFVSKTEELASLQGTMKEVSGKIELKNTELSTICSSLNEDSNKLELKRKELEAVEKSIADLEGDLKLREENYTSIQSSISKCTEELKLEEKKLDLVKISITECTKELALSEKKLKWTTGRTADIESREKELSSLRSSVENRAEILAEKERQFEQQLREFHSCQEHLNTTQKSLENERGGVELRDGVKVVLPQVKIETVESVATDGSFLSFIRRYLSVITEDPVNLHWLVCEFLEIHSLVREKVWDSIRMSSDPAKLVLGALSSTKGHGRYGIDIIKKSYMILIGDLSRLSPEITSHVKEAALKLASQWKAKLNPDIQFDVLAFLHLLAVYELGRSFNANELQSLLNSVSQFHRQTDQLRDALGVSTDLQGALGTVEVKIENFDSSPGYETDSLAADPQYADPPASSRMVGQMQDSVEGTSGTPQAYQQKRRRLGI